MRNPRNQLTLPALLLRGQLGLMRLGPAGCTILVLCCLGLAGWSWVLTQRLFIAAPPMASATALTDAVSARLIVGEEAAVTSSSANLALFYATLAERQSAEKQVKMLFAMAAKSGLILDQGEYKLSYDAASAVSRYTVLLPIKGSYQAIWRFSLQVLRTMPFAALDELNFRRESIADATPVARLHFTLYLKQSSLAGPA